MKKEREPLLVDYSTCIGAGRIEPGVYKAGLKEAKAVQKRVRAEVREGRLGYFKLPARYLEKAAMAPVHRCAKRLLHDFEDFVVIGIGGSGLGNRMLLNGLAHRYHNDLAPSDKHGLRVFMLENNDPDSFSALFDAINLERTVFNVISKSGSTVETMAQFALVRDLLKREFPNDWQQRLVVTTDPKAGTLRELAVAEGLETLDLPTDTGGRFSVLTPVGLLTAAVTKLDTKGLLAGAAAMAERCLLDDPEQNPALKGALLHYLADRDYKKNMVVVFPYADKLRDYAEWFAQLWGESIGKEMNSAGERVCAGTTPIKALGTIDQHSQMQLYMEGPNDKVIQFIRVGKFAQALPFPKAERLPKAYDYLAGHSMQELIHAELTASRFALGEKGRTTYEITLPKMDAYALGELIFFAEAMTTYAGYLYGVNPFDQPGVELGKKFAYGLMGRAGFESFRERIEGKKK